MLAEQIGDAIARGGGRDTGLKLMPQLNTSGARQYSADQKHGTADQLKSEFGRRFAGKSRRMIPRRHVEQRRGGNEPGEGGDPKIKPQRRKNDEDEIAQRS